MSGRISAIICTLNRADYLRKAITSLVDQTLPKEQYEIIVVDNGSTDNTRQVIREEFGYVSNLRYIYEPVLGLSQARNTGWKNARGEYVAYLDDDAVADQGWLGKIVEVFETVKPQPGCVGGKVEPIWEVPRPVWLSDNLALYLAILDYSETPVVLDNPDYLVGASIAYPRHLLEMMGGFQTSLGRRGKSLLSNEETLLHRELNTMGYACMYHPEIIAWHHIQAYRLKKAWFIRRLYWQGVSDALVQIEREPPSALRRLRFALSATRRVLSPQRLADLAVPSNDPQRFERKCSTFQQIGYLVGLLGMAG